MICSCGICFTLDLRAGIELLSVRNNTKRVDLFDKTKFLVDVDIRTNVCMRNRAQNFRTT